MSFSVWLRLMVWRICRHPISFIFFIWVFFYYFCGPTFVFNTIPAAGGGVRVEYMQSASA